MMSNIGQRLNLIEDIQELEDIIEDQYKLLLKAKHRILKQKICADLIILIAILEYEVSRL